MSSRKAAMLALIAATIATAGCERTDNEPGPGGVTVGEAKALDDAADMLESRDEAPSATPAKPKSDEKSQ